MHGIEQFKKIPLDVQERVRDVYKTMRELGRVDWELKVFSYEDGLCLFLLSGDSEGDAGDFADAVSEGLVVLMFNCETLFGRPDLNVVE